MESNRSPGQKSDKTSNIRLSRSGQWQPTNGVNGHVIPNSSTSDKETLSASGVTARGNDLNGHAIHTRDMSENGYLNGNISDSSENDEENCEEGLLDRASRNQTSGNGANKVWQNSKTINGVNVRPSDYSQSVCNTYRHENEVIFGRTRGGFPNRETDVVVVTPNVQFVNNNLTPERTVNSQQNLIGANGSEALLQSQESLTVYTYNTDSESSTSRNISDYVPNNVPGLHAPLAEPESLSDDDTSVIARHNKRDNTDYKETNSAFEVGKVSPNNVVECCTAENDDIVGSNIVTSSVDQSEVKSDTETESDNDFVEHDLNIEAVETRNNLTPDSNDIDEGNESEHSALSNSSDNEINNEESVELNEEVVENIVEEQTEEDNVNDDIGDFIEADLPPNVERLVFFSRDSSSEEEDEGCGDEVLPNNDEDIESDNETIDPTAHAESTEGLREHLYNVVSQEPHDGPNSVNNCLSFRAQGARGEMSDIYPCNISCDKSSEENDLDYDELFIGPDDVPGARAVECAACSQQDHSRSSSLGDQNSAMGKGDNLCACCDRPMEVDNERQKEMGVNVCDKCFKEHNIEQKRWTENLYGTRRRSHLSGASCSMYSQRNGNTSPQSHLLNNNYDKVSNNSSMYTRFSSSESDPYDRVFVSDTSDVSPEQDYRADPLFQSSNIPTSFGNVQYREVSITLFDLESIFI